MNTANNADLSLRVTSANLALEFFNSKRLPSDVDYNVTDLSQWFYDWFKDGYEIDNPAKPSFNVVQ